MNLDPPYDNYAAWHDHLVRDGLDEDAWEHAMDYGPRLDVVEDRLGRIFVWDPFPAEGVDQVLAVFATRAEAVAYARKRLAT